MSKKKWFSIATEGATTDGRRISREWIQQMADNYDPKTYGARVNLEHLRGVLPDSPFKAYGDITGLKAEEVEGKLKLFAEIDPTTELVDLSKKRQKVYTSMEVDPEFADTGEAYLVGVAITDSPASLGTEMLQFSATASTHPLADRKQRPENLFSAAEPVTLEFSDSDGTPNSGKDSLLGKVKALFRRHQAEVQSDQSNFRQDLEATLELFVQRISAIESQVASLSSPAGSDDLQAKHEELASQFAALKADLEKQPGSQFTRSPATGSDAPAQTDC